MRYFDQVQYRDPCRRVLGQPDPVGFVTRVYSHDVVKVCWGVPGWPQSLENAAQLKLVEDLFLSVVLQKRWLVRRVGRRP